jgi:hypothetical protein
METRDLTTKLMAKTPKIVRNCEGWARRDAISEACGQQLLEGPKIGREVSALRGSRSESYTDYYRRCPSVR